MARKKISSIKKNGNWNREEKKKKIVLSFHFVRQKNISLFSVHLSFAVSRNVSMVLRPCHAQCVCVHVSHIYWFNRTGVCGKWFWSVYFFSAIGLDIICKIKYYTIWLKRKETLAWKTIKLSLNRKNRYPFFFLQTVEMKLLGRLMSHPFHLIFFLQLFRAKTTMWWIKKLLDIVFF